MAKHHQGALPVVVMTLQDKLAADIGTFAIPEIPEDSGSGTWSKHFRCVYPDCEGRAKAAAVKYDRGLAFYVCHRCDRSIAAGVHWDSNGEVAWKVHLGNDVVSRFWGQIIAASRRIHGKFPYLVSEHEARQYAQDRVRMYAGEPTFFSHPDGDTGKLAEWEEQVKGDPDQLDRFVSQALNTDLIDYAKAKLRERGEVTGIDADAGSEHDVWPVGNVPNDPTADRAMHHLEPSVPWEEYPTLAFRYRDGMTREEIAGKCKVSVSTVQRRMNAEVKRLKENVTQITP